MSAEALRALLDPACVPGAIEWCGEIDSTNAELLRRGAAQADLSLLIADAQHAGRGRPGRAWQSPPDANLYLSLFLRLPDPRCAAGLSLVAGVAAAEALHALGARDVRLKWPNDLLVEGRKLGGILIELAGGGAVIGIGINVRMPHEAAAAIGQPWTDLASLGVPATRVALAAALVTALLPRLAAFRVQGLDAALRARWDALHAHAGREVRVSEGDASFEGRALGLAEDGALRVATSGGERRVHAGDVSLRPA